MTIQEVKKLTEELMTAGSIFGITGAAVALSGLVLFAIASLKKRN